MLEESSRALLEAYPARRDHGDRGRVSRWIALAATAARSEAGAVARQQRRQLRASRRRGLLERRARDDVAERSDPHGRRSAEVAHRARGRVRRRRRRDRALQPEPAGAHQPRARRPLRRRRASAIARAGTSGSAASRSHLESLCKQTVRIDALRLDVSFKKGERVYTESSYKYSFAEIERLARAAGLVVAERWLDGGKRFSVNLLAPLSG